MTRGVSASASASTIVLKSVTNQPVAGLMGMATPFLKEFMAPHWNELIELDPMRDHTLSFERKKEKLYREKIAFPTDEAVGLDMLMYRHQEAPELMLGCFENESLIAYTCATRYHAASMKKEAMNMHIPNGESVCIHSICVEESMRRQGIALKLLSHLIESIRKNQYGAVRILLITKSRLIPLYTRLGFVLRCRSSIAHGHDKWYEFELKLK